MGEKVGYTNSKNLLNTIGKFGYIKLEIRLRILNFSDNGTIVLSDAKIFGGPDTIFMKGL